MANSRVTKARYFLFTYGCQMNQADSELVARLLERAGWQPAASPEEADLVLLNTCCVREKPEHKLHSRLGELARLKQRRPQLLVAVAGCIAQKEGDRLLARSPGVVDLVVGTRQFHRLPELVEQVRAAGQPLTCLEMDSDPSQARLAALASSCEPISAGLRANGDQAILGNGATGLAVRAAASRPGITAFVPVIRGCTNFCTYCIVPFVRGPEVSRQPEEIRAEVGLLAQRGCKQVTLLGQNVLAYGADLEGGWKFARLLDFLHPVEGIERLRFTTAHPRDGSEELIETAARLPKVCEHFHLPIQSGNDRILAEMRRGYDTAYYRNLAGKIRSRLPLSALTSDIMVGFPGETEEEFGESLRFYEELRFDQAFMFAYSPREGTAAARMAGQLPRQVKVERLRRLIERQNRISLEKNQELVGRSEEVLVEAVNQKRPGQLLGRTRSNRLAVFAGEAHLVGELVQVRVTRGHLWGVEGEPEER